MVRGKRLSSSPHKARNTIATMPVRDAVSTIPQMNSAISAAANAAGSRLRAPSQTALADAQTNRVLK